MTVEYFTMEVLYKTKGGIEIENLSFYLFFTRKFCSTCNCVFDTPQSETTPEGDKVKVDHKGHSVHIYHGDVLLLLGFGHLEAKLQSCFIQVSLLNSSIFFLGQENDYVQQPTQSQC